MLEAVPLLAVTLMFLSFFTYIFVSTELDTVRKQWNERRCEPMVMLIAQLVPDPKDTKIDRNKFASDNFNFCLQGLVDASMGIAATPVMKIFQTQVDATKPIQTAINNTRGAATGLLSPLTEVFGSFYKRFQAVGYNMSRVGMKMMSALSRVFGVGVASLFAGMSMYKSIQNSMNFVINICITILTILVALVIILWFVMWPVIPIVLTLIGVLSATVHAGNVSGMSGSFCVAPETPIVREDGSVSRVDTLKVGDILADGAVVEGILETLNTSPCVSVKGVVLSGTHLVLSEEGHWIFAAKHPDAQPVSDQPARLFCLNTSTHTWRTESGLVLRDWEELPEGFDEEWEELIEHLLNKSMPPRSPEATRISGRGLCGEGALVWEQRTGPKVLRDIRLGDFIKDRRNQFTRVLGIYHDSEEVPRAGLSQAGWIWSPDQGRWVHPVQQADQLETSPGIHLITDTGSFLLYGSMWIRDFTEVGATLIHHTYPFTQSRLHFTEPK